MGTRQLTAARNPFGVAAIVIALLLSPAAASRAADTDPPVVSGQFLDEGFEDTGAFPPAGWTYVPNAVPPNTWHTTTNPAEVHGGAAAAVIRRQTAYTQYEVLVSPRLDLQSAPPGGLRFSFWYRTDPFWFHGTTDLAVFRVHASMDSASWEPLFRIDDVVETGWAWRNVVVDLAGYAGQQSGVLLRFTYAGSGLADVAIDDVRVGYLEAPAPPVNDTCDGASIPAFTIGPDAGPFQVTGNSFFALPDYALPPTGCTGYATDARDLVWRVQIPAGHRLAATMTTLGDWDDTLFLVESCLDPDGTCVAGDRGFPDGAHLVFENPGAATGTYWLVASGWGNAAGEFVLDGAIESIVSVEPTSWGRLKASYRGSGR